MLVHEVMSTGVVTARRTDSILSVVTKMLSRHCGAIPVVEDNELLIGMVTLRDDLADIELRLDEAERAARQLPHREKYLLLVNGFLRRLLDLHRDLIDQVEQDLQGDSLTTVRR